MFFYELLLKVGSSQGRTCSTQEICSTGSDYCLLLGTGSVYCLILGTRSVYCLIPGPRSVHCLIRGARWAHCVMCSTRSDPSYDATSVSEPAWSRQGSSVWFEQYFTYDKYLYWDRQAVFQIRLDPFLLGCPDTVFYCGSRSFLFFSTLFYNSNH
jgi:hypothetical protein